MPSPSAFLHFSRCKKRKRNPMKYFIICGEASGDLHASHLITALRSRDNNARFRFFGGDLMMEAAGKRGTLLRHYTTLAYMGFIQVILHARTILRGLKECKTAIEEWRPDCVIMVDYPGFNLRIASYVKKHHLCPVVYYIPPKIWAWKEHRIKSIRRFTDRVLSILPFEEDYYRDSHDFEVEYVGNPTYDEIAQHLAEKGKDIADADTFGQNGRKAADIIALLPGSRIQEIKGNLPVMLEAVAALQDENVKRPFCFFIGAVPNIDDKVYEQMIRRHAHGIRVDIWRKPVYDLLLTTRAALVTSGTATLETAILDVPQVVCYHVMGGRFINWVQPYFLNCPFISLVNLIAGRAIVPELVAADMKMPEILDHLREILDGEVREKMLEDYGEMRERLGKVGAPEAAADSIVRLLRKKDKSA